MTKRCWVVYLANPAEVETLSDDQQVSELLAAVRRTSRTTRRRCTCPCSRALSKSGVSRCRSVATSDDDRLLSVDEAAEILKVTPQWLYRHARSLPFSRACRARRSDSPRLDCGGGQRHDGSPDSTQAQPQSSKCDDLRRGCMLMFLKRGQFFRRLSQHALFDDRVTSINRLGLVADHGHGGGSRYSARSRFRTAVRRKSCGICGSFDAFQALRHSLLYGLIASPSGAGKTHGTRQPIRRSSVPTSTRCS